MVQRVLAKKKFGDRPPMGGALVSCFRGVRCDQRTMIDCNTVQSVGEYGNIANDRQK